MSNPFVTHPTVSSFIEGSILGFVALFNGGVAVTDAITETDWTRLTGQHGAIFVLSVVGLAFWAKAIRDGKARVKEDEARERRHVESLAASEKHFQTLIAMNNKNAEDLKGVSMESIKSQIECTAAIQALAKELAGRPCGMTNFSIHKKP